MAAKTARKSPGIGSSLKNLSISPTGSSKSPNSKSGVPPDSWEEEATSPISSSSSDPTTPSGPSTPLADSTPGPPPPTPISPSYHRDKSADLSSFPMSTMNRNSPRVMLGLPSSSDKAEKRPEKSSATAGRIIAGALGVKGPSMTEDQRRYEKAMREKERKRIEREREEERRSEKEKEEARRSVWD